MKLKILTANLCAECMLNIDSKTTRWVKVLKVFSSDIIFLQEIDKYNVTDIASGLSMIILNIDHKNATAILISGKLKVIDNHHIRYKDKPIFVSNIHLTDIPSVSHHIKNISYKSSEIIPLSTPMNKILTMCKRRLPDIKSVITQSKSLPAIIAGDFNEPSHLDMKLNLPVSQFMQKNKFIDSYRISNNDEGFTWPASGFYSKEPPQRIDFIYTRCFVLKRKTKCQEILHTIESLTYEEFIKNLLN